jgi:endonuclease-8
VLARLGPDPLRKGRRPELAWRADLAQPHGVGALLMDQSVLAGVGNVYRAEVLYRAGLSPFRPGATSPARPGTRMWRDLRGCCAPGCAPGHIVTTEREDRDRRSGPARREDRFYVYRRHGLPCRRCGTEVRTQVMAGRNLFWCPSCQPA